MENKANRIYDKGTRQWFDVSPDAYEAYDRERTAFRKKMQHQGLCCCPRSKWWLCDMACMYCDYRCDGTLSLNMPQGDDEDVTLMDIIPDMRMKGSRAAIPRSETASTPWLRTRWPGRSI